MIATRHPARWTGTALALFCGVMLSGGPSARPANAQISREGVPSSSYQMTFGLYHDGEYRGALKSYLREGRGAIKTVQSSWIDSICYHAMSGECYYQMGQLPEALEHYTSAIRLYVAFSDWMVRVRFPEAIRPETQINVRRRVTWGQTKRQVQLGDFPRSIPISQGQIDAGKAFRQGGVVEKPVLFSIDVIEIIRCTTLAIRRRTELLGPACRHDPLTGQLLTALTRRPGLPNHWSECWIDLQLGLAEAAAGKEPQAVSTLQRAVLAGGQFDHPMTCIALFELGRLALKQGDFAKAADYFAEATYSAASYGDLGVLEEAFRYGAIVHLMANNKSLFPPLAEAIRWAKTNRYGQLHCSLLLAAAENYAVLGQTKQAAGMLEEAGAVLSRRDMAAGHIGARHSFLTALVLFQQGNIGGGDRAAAAAMDYMRHGSHRLFQIGLVDKLHLDGVVTPRVASDLYADVLRDPTESDWLTDPMESLATLVSPHPVPLEHWFEVAIEHKEHEKAFEIADRARRHRFFSSRPFGGRLESLRWILEGPEQVLNTKDQLHRRDLRVQFPEYEKASQAIREFRATLTKAPIVPEAGEPATLQRKNLAELGALGQRQEAVLRQIAVRREPAGLVFPPLRSTGEIQKALPKGHALLTFFATSRQLYAFLLNSEKYGYWQVGAPTMLNKQVVGLLRDMGHFDPNHEIPLKEIVDAKWRKSAENLLSTILKGSKADFTAQFEQLTIVPDGVLWYVPFEALQVPVNGEPQALGSRFQIRYAATAGLAIPDGRGRKASGTTGVVVGRLFPNDDPAVAKKAFDQLAQALPGAVALPSPLPAPSALYRTLLDRLIVYDDIQLGKSGPYGWEPIQIEHGKPGNTLDDWLSLPWGGPETIILPGFHTAAESALKQPHPNAGQEVFLSVCGLMASGAETVLLSRWRTGGQTCFDLIREFAQELPHASPSEAWQRATALCIDSHVNLDAEPRIKRTSNDDAPKASHPFFWAGYMLFDPGEAVGGKQ